VLELEVQSCGESQDGHEKCRHSGTWVIKFDEVEKRIGTMEYHYETGIDVLILLSALSKDLCQIII
jgi:hypothetical protein